MTVTPTVVTVEGDADQLSTLVSVNTMPVSINGASSALDHDRRPGPADRGRADRGHARSSVKVDLPAGHLDAELRGRRPAGRGSARTSPTAIDVDRVLATIGGSVADLDRLEASTLVMDLDVAGLGAGHLGGPRDGRAARRADPGRREPGDRPGHRHRARPGVATGGLPVRVAVARGRLIVARLFGTDGIRGVANVDLKPTLAYALGRATAHHLAEPGGAIVVGQDTRRSGDMFVSAIAAGASSVGVDVQVVGVVPTPALAFLARTGPFAGRDHGLGLAQPGRRQRPEGPRPRRASSSTTPSRTSWSS